MISPAALQIIEGSVPWKVIQFLDANPDEQLDIELVSAKYDCPRSQVHTLLSGAVQAGALARSTCRDTGEVIYSKARRALSITAPAVAFVVGTYAHSTEGPNGVPARR